jgi:hypothetical protein
LLDIPNLSFTLLLLANIIVLNVTEICLKNLFEDVEPPVRMFSMENVADRVFHRKKKMVGVFDDEETRRNDYRNKLAILKGDLESGGERMAISGEDMEDWFQKIQIRTRQHQVCQVTPGVTTKLAATNNVAAAAVR